MALFQPTNVSPSLLGELGDGVVDAVYNSVYISWQVNGDSPMVAYKIDIYQNNAASTLVHTTGKVVLSEPFHGVDYAGNIQRFYPGSVTSSGITNGNSYKLKITQWWGSTDAESVEQSSMSAFITRKKPTLTITSVPSSVTTRSYAFTATYTQDQGDTLNWVRWYITWIDDNSEEYIIADTGKIYGTSELRFDYDGFFNGESYFVFCEVQTQNGVEATDVEWFNVSYSTETVIRPLRLRYRKQQSGMQVSWFPMTHYSGQGTTYSFSNGAVVVPAGSSIEWDNLSISNTYMGTQAGVTAMFRWNAASLAVGNKAFSMTLTDGTVNAEIDIDITSVDSQYVSATIKLLVSSTVVASQNVQFSLSYGKWFWMIGGKFTAQNGYIGFSTGKTIEAVKNGFTNLYSSTNFGDFAIDDIVFSGQQTLDYCAVQQQYPAEIELSEWFNVASPLGDIRTPLLTLFNKSTLEAGSLDGTITQGTGKVFELYRVDGDYPIMKKINTLYKQGMSTLDCAIPSGHSATYYLYVGGTNSNAGTYSETVTPTFWDWAIFECETHSDGTHHPVNIFLFGKNLDSGTISNNNAPNILQNFTRYPTIQRAVQNYMSGTLQSYIGMIDPNTAEYSDTLTQRNAIYALSTTSNRLFLRNRKGDMFPIQIAGSIGFTTLDGSRSQALNASVPWVQTGDMGSNSVILQYGDALFPDIGYTRPS